LQCMAVYTVLLLHVDLLSRNMFSKNRFQLERKRRRKG
jgi:hypothetical protein